MDWENTTLEVWYQCEDVLPRLKPRLLLPWHRDSECQALALPGDTSALAFLSQLLVQSPPGSL